MEHLAIINRRLATYEDILSGKKTIESRWYKNKILPWNKIIPGDVIYFKEVGKKVEVKAIVEKVIQIERFDNDDELKKIVSKYRGLGYINLKSSTEEILKWAKDKRYVILIFFNKAEKVKSFDINKSGYGISNAWITLENINKIKR